MHEQTPQEVRPGTPSAAPPSGGDGTFTLKKRFPGEAALAPLTPAPPTADIRAKSARRLILPLILFLALIGGIAYISQNLRKGTRAERPGGDGGPGGVPVVTKDVLKFADDLRDTEPEKSSLFHARWDHPDPKHTGYAAELERNSHGHYDFLFVNPLDQSVDLGLHDSKCDCSHVELAVLPGAVNDTPGKQPEQAVLAKMLAKNVSWAKVMADDKRADKKIGTVPSHCSGVVRVAWHNRKGEGESLNLLITLWAQAQGAKIKTRQYVLLHVPTLVVAPIQFERPLYAIGEVTARGTTVTFACWSATRDDPKLTLPEKQDDPLFHWQLVPLTPTECKELEERLGKARNTRVKAGYRVSVTVYEERKGKQLDQGSFNRYPPLLLDGLPLEHSGTRIEGSVRGDVEVRGEAKDGFVEAGQIRFGNFHTSAGTSAELILRADADVNLEVVAKGQIPPYLKVKLAEGKLTPDKKKSWRLDVEVPAQIPAGPLPRDSAVVLRKITQGAPPRQIRIPIVGSAVQR